MARTTSPKAKSKSAPQSQATPAAVAPDQAKLMKKPELLDAVVTRTNLKKRDVKPAVEAALAVITQALRDGNELNLPPMGKLRLVKSKDLGEGATVMTLKLRTPKNAAHAITPTDE